MGTTRVQAGTSQPGVVGNVVKDTEKAAQAARELQESKSSIKPVPEDELENVRAARKENKDRAPEIVDSIMLELPNGRKVEMQQPKVATAFALSRIVGNNEGSISIVYLKALMYIARLDGEQVLPLSNMIDAQQLANKLGDDGFDIILTAYSTYWPTVLPENLPVIKKNLRG